MPECPHSAPGVALIFDTDQAHVEVSHGAVRILLTESAATLALFELQAWVQDGLHEA